MRRAERTKRHPAAPKDDRPFPQYPDNPPPIVAVVRDIILFAAMARETGPNEATVNHCCAFLDIIRMRVTGANPAVDNQFLIDWAAEYSRPKEATTNA